MVGKVSERVLLREGRFFYRFELNARGAHIANHDRPGLERTDNGMKQTSWPDVAPINQKNYYT
jgi:actin-related protein 8